MSPLCAVSAASVLPGLVSTELEDSREGEGRHHPTSRQSTREASLVSFHQLWVLGPEAVSRLAKQITDFRWLSGSLPRRGWDAFRGVGGASSPGVWAGLPPQGVWAGLPLPCGRGSSQRNGRSSLHGLGQVLRTAEFLKHFTNNRGASC